MRERRYLRALWIILLPLLIFPLFFLALLSRFVKKPVDIGLGPHPLINNVYHKTALERRGYSAETSVVQFVLHYF